jgi:hypothetical protein
MAHRRFPRLGADGAELVAQCPQPGWRLPYEKSPRACLTDSTLNAAAST